MTKNVGTIDRALRVIVGLALIALAATGTVGIWGYIGVVPIATAAIGWCPAYLPFGIKTCKTAESA
ncbi:MAG: YgaP family membrane protein [Rhodospirillaceae bacterium]